MTVGNIILCNGIQANEDIGSFGVIYVDAREGHPLRVRLGVVTDEEHRYTLSVGDPSQSGIKPGGSRPWRTPGQRTGSSSCRRWADVRSTPSPPW
jgi:hypothetical protein